MSAYLCSDLDTVAVAVAICQHFPESADVVSIAQALRDANNRALRARYGDDAQPLGPIGGAIREHLAIDYVQERPDTAHSLARELQYQCAEGDVLETHPIMPRVAALIEATEAAAAAVGKARAAAAAELQHRQHLASESTRVIAADSAPLFYWNGLKDAKGEKLQKAWYSAGGLIGWPEGTISIYARDYRRFSAKVSAAFDVENRTDTQSDYFCNDTIRVIPSHPLYAQVKAAWQAQEAHRDAATAKRASRRC